MSLKKESKHFTNKTNKMDSMHRNFKTKNKDKRRLNTSKELTWYNKLSSVAENTSELTTKKVNLKNLKVKKEEKGVINTHEGQSQRLKGFNETKPKSKVKQKHKKIKKKKSKIENEVVGTLSDFKPVLDSFRNHDTMLIARDADWNAQMIKESKYFTPVDMKLRRDLKELAEKLYFHEINIFKRSEGNSETDYQQAIISEGARRDRVAAKALACVNAPLHSLSTLASITELLAADVKLNYKELIDNIKSLINSAYLSKSFIAKDFENHDFSKLLPLIKTNRDLLDKQLILWCFEDKLKMQYKKIIYQLDQLCGSSIQANRRFAMNGIISLLESHPFQDGEFVIQKIVNKIGNPDKQTASLAVKALVRIQRTCQHLRNSIILSVEEFMYRANLSKQTQYYSLCFLSQSVIDKRDTNHVKKLLNIYFGFFKTCTKSGDVDTRLMAVLLHGLKRIVAFLPKEEIAKLEEHICMIYKLSHVVKFSVATQALTLVYHVSKKNSDACSDRYYQVLYNLLLNKDFIFTTPTTFLNLLYLSMSRDPLVSRVKAFAKRLLQLCKLAPAKTVCAVLYLISETVKDNPSILTVQHLIHTTQNNYKDVILKKEELTSESNSQVVHKNDTKTYINNNNLPNTDSNCYDPQKRNPLYSRAEMASMWELSTLLHHYHPAVPVLVSTLLQGKLINYRGDPLQDYSLMHFLDRFTIKNDGENKSRKKEFLSRRMNTSSRKFLSLPSHKVAAEDLFLHKFLKKNEKRKSSSQKKGDKDEDEIDEEFEAQVDDYLEDLDAERGGGGGRKKRKEKEDDKEFATAMAEEEEEEEDFDEDDIDFAAGTDKDRLQPSKRKNTNTEFDEDSDNLNDDIESDDDDDDEDGISDEDNEDNCQKVPKAKKIERNHNSDDDSEEEDSSFDEAEFEGDPDIEELKEALKNVKNREGYDHNVDSDTDESDIGPGKSKKRQKMMVQPSTKRCKKGGNLDLKELDDVAVDADEFERLLEANAGDHWAATSEAIRNRDNASAKQLNWERERGTKKGTRKPQQKFKVKKMQKRK